MNINQKIGKNIRKLREAKGLTAEKLAWFSGLSGSCISNAERGVADTKISTIAAICKTLEISMEDFFKGF